MNQKLKVYISQKTACFINFIFNKVIIVYIKSDCMYRMKVACTVQVSFGLVLVLMPVEII